MMVPFLHVHNGQRVQAVPAVRQLIYSKREKTPENLFLLKSKYILLVFGELTNCQLHQEIDDFSEYIAKVVFSIKKFMMEVNELW